MATNLDLDDELIEMAKEVGNHRSKKEAVIAALKEYVRNRKQKEVLKLFGKLEFDPGPFFKYPVYSELRGDLTKRKQFGSGKRYEN